MEFRDEKRRLYRRLIVRGAKRQEFKEVATQANVAAPPELIEKWEDRFFQNPIDSFPAQPRLINRFCVGADPEFIFEFLRLDRYGNPVPKYEYAEKLGLNTMDAFGADMSGRQAELRAYPSRFVLEVIASLVDTLRWMNECHNLDAYNWIAPARYGDDGVGGHVHIGRKRPGVPACVESLDAVTRLLLDAKVLDYKGQAQRQANTRYGHWSDWRRQSHGYEYRTMPSWMTSPWAAYFTLVVSKLCVLDDAREFLDNNRPQETLVNLLRAYKSRDDDARIALLALDKLGFPKFDPTDFKTRWGVGGCSGLVNIARTYFPPVIKPTDATKRELFDHLTQGKPLPPSRLKPTWMPVALPDGMFKPHAQAHVYGVSDVAQGLLSKGYPVTYYQGDRGMLTVQAPQKMIDQAALREEVSKREAIAHWGAVVKPTHPKDQTILIHMPPDIYDNHAHAVDKDKLTAMRSLLTETGLFPIFKYGDFDKPLVQRVMPVVVKKKPLGKIVTCIKGEQDVLEAVEP